MTNLMTALFAVLPALAAGAVLLATADAFSAEMQAKRLIARRFRRYN